MACWNWGKYRWRAKWSKFWNLTNQQRALLIQSLWLSVTFALAIKGFGLRRVLSFLQSISPDRRHLDSYPPQAASPSSQSSAIPHSPTHLPSPNDRLDHPERSPQLSQAYELAHFVELASRNPVYPVNCLPKSLTLCWLLRQRGIPARLQIGVSVKSQEFRAHAWVEYAGYIINDRPDIDIDFLPFPNIETALLQLKHHNSQQSPKSLN